ncbi:MAG: ATP-dependent Clp protease ATP-binding subunit ClpX [Lachnospiraceae bacterium]|nr:ATP-dependent Clp protease ATP-binding subunit ClpX [Lachnospiraceae bacterium]
MNDNNEFKEVIDGVDSTEPNDNDHSEDGYEKVCYICHRPESKAGKMITIPNNIYICSDCMQRTFDSMTNLGFNMPGMPPVPSKDAEEKPSGEEQTKAGSDEKEKEKDKNLNNVDFSQMPSISLMNLSDLMNMFPNMGPKKVKPKKKKEEDIKPVFDINHIPHPHEIKAKLDDYVVGQDHAKKVMSVAVYNHYKRVATNTMDEIEIEKSNILMLGPTGSGKTYMVRTLARLLDVPLAITDATSLTEAGYIGDDIESVVSKLLANADNDVEKAEQGIIFIDEIDKIAKKRNTNYRDVSGESVQQGMLKLLEGSEVEVPVGASSKNAMVPMTTVNTRNILFICGGAFPDLDNTIKERLNKESSMGFVATLKDKYDEDKDILSKATAEDLKNFGLIPEFIGRLPIICAFQPLDEDMLVRILKEPKNAIIKQYQKLLELDEVELIFTDGALHAIAKQAHEKELGARALRAIIEDFMLDIMYEIPKDDNIGRVTITEDYIEKKGGPQIEMRSTEKMIEEKK